MRPAFDLRPLSRPFDDTRVWIFDLDNTLYPAECNLFAQVDHKMGEFVARYLDVPYPYARYLQKSYYRQFGTTLSGMMTVHGMQPKPFLDYVHDIDVSHVPENRALGEAIGRLPGRKLIFTNGTVRHAENVAGKIGILDHFEAIYDIAAAGYVPKPHRAPYEDFVARYLIPHSATATTAAMFEDMPHNLEVPHALGMRTVLVHATADYDAPVQAAIRAWKQPPEHVHHMTADLIGFLRQLA